MPPDEIFTPLPPTFATTLLILTDIEQIYLNFLGARREPVHRMTVYEAQSHLDRGEFLPESMAPKVEAAIAFLQGGGKRVLIGLPEELPQLFEGAAGMHIA